MVVHVIKLSTSQAEAEAGRSLVDLCVQSQPDQELV